MTPLRVALAGNPNVGKTSLFNELTGARHKVGNYAGVTVETRAGAVVPRLSPARPITVLDLPGTYSLTPIAEDEAVAFRCLAGAEGDPPDVVALVLDAANLARNLYLAVQLLELGRPLVVALNMMDVAAEAGMPVDPAALARALGVPVVPTVARTGEGIARLVEALGSIEHVPQAISPLRARLLADDDALPAPPGIGAARWRWLVSAAAAGTLELAGATAEERAALAAHPAADVTAAAHARVIARYREVDALLAEIGFTAAQRERAPAMSRSAAIDRVLTHRVWGLLIFVGVMATIFSSIFTWAEPLMGAIESLIGWLSEQVAAALGPGVFTDLLTQGVLAGAGNVLVFVPQIALLFLLLGVLEDSGYMARAAFLVDRLMARVGLHGRAFVPLLSGYACAIPAILGTRTITDPRDRLATILMIPFMSCSARLPIYVLFISALFPADDRVGPFTVGSLMLVGFYALSTVSALAAGAIWKRTALRGPTPPFVLELPPYRLPRLRNTLLHVYDRTADFVRQAGTVILSVTVVLWVLLSFPRPPDAPDGGRAVAEAVQVDPAAHVPEGMSQGAAAHVPEDMLQATDEDSPIIHSIGGRIGKAMEPVLQPMGQDFRMGIAILGSFAAREVMISTLGLVYGIEADDENQTPLREKLREAREPDGSRRHTPLKGLAAMIFFVYACQCMSTLAVVRRETRSWKWPLVMFATMSALAYGLAVLVYQVGRALGYT
ncbi:ferrous iron transport protein B [Nannocystis exedens]|uniref:Ferrous iron transport protein B n=1 Tax=Nannocystis exedens TaxID=54 RepID=A0A1I1Y0R0_9BACT|nr:ferrous iron transport protein B [Nannocystis exedens]PCC71743.1 ferrous iron transporter B [Nannocystis exedens]SFE13134.1 ferrous iron transport protein B [Nannocystis exedens]